MNRVELFGRLGGDPEVKTTNDVTVAKFSIATTEKRKEGEHTEWHRIVAFGKLAEVCGKYLSKGRQIVLEGKLYTHKWQDKVGSTHWTTEVIAKEIHFISEGRKEGAEPNYPVPDFKKNEPADNKDDVNIEDIPF